MGTVLGAGFFAALDGSLDELDSPDALAAFVGVALAPHDTTRATTTATSTGRSAATR
ncbi:hypothetical protein ACFYOD_33340 [Streptomyces sp. NPDC006703]|uniref:hypothetical protein n=1 Tax=Streptomyces sp. NPDC006703 TaxID=3364759 RepID=UPI00367BB97E